MRDDGEGALSAITVSSRELIVRGAAGAGLGRGRVCAERPRQLLLHPLQKAIPTSSRWPAPPGLLSLLGLPHAG